ncbi:MAG: aminotransferase class I/II-fold pyridoxal phosphate-dependent enzyme [Anaerolineales bacterium]
MNSQASKQGMTTLMNHIQLDQKPYRAHITPIYQTSVFTFPDVASAAKVYSGEEFGYSYTRTANPNVSLLETKLAVLEGWDLIGEKGPEAIHEVVGARVFASGMAAVSSALLAIVGQGDTILAQRALYGGTYGFMEDIAPRFGIRVHYVEENSPEGWAAAFEEHPEARLAFAETPANPGMEIIDLAMLCDLAHDHDCPVMVDNTFATPYCQRPLTLGADVVLHSTTKYLSGHGVIIGGAVISTLLEYVRESVHHQRKRLGGSASPFDAWLIDLGLKTFELRMQRHCSNAMAVARHLATHPQVEKVYYPGLESHAGHEIACRQMSDFSGMLSFELRGGFHAAEKMLNSVRMATLGVSLGNVDTLIQHPAGMTHAHVPPAVRKEMGISDGLIRLSVGIENLDDLLADLDQALAQV